MSVLPEIHASAVGLVGAIQEVQCLNCDDGGLLEWVGAVAGVLGGVAAVLALWQARRSARDAHDSAVHSRRSADAAEQTAQAAKDQLDLAREEALVARAERSRRPELKVGAVLVTGVRPATEEGPGLLPLVVEIVNDGTRASEEATLYALTASPPGFDTSLQTDSVILHSDYAGKVEDIGRGPEPTTVWTGVMDKLGADEKYRLENLALLHPGPGKDVPIQVIIKDRQTGEQVVSDWIVSVSDDGDAATVATRPR